MLLQIWMPRSLIRLTRVTVCPTRPSSPAVAMPMLLLRTCPRCCGLLVLGAENSMSTRRRCAGGKLTAASSSAGRETVSRHSAAGVSVMLANAFTTVVDCTSAWRDRNPATNSAICTGLRRNWRASRKPFTVRSAPNSGGHRSTTRSVTGVPQVVDRCCSRSLTKANFIGQSIPLGPAFTARTLRSAHGLTRSA